MIVARALLPVIVLDNVLSLAAEGAIVRAPCIPLRRLASLVYADLLHEGHVQQTVLRLRIHLIVLDILARIEDIVEYLRHLDAIDDVWHDESHPKRLFLLSAILLYRAIYSDVGVAWGLRRISTL